RLAGGHGEADVVDRLDGPSAAAEEAGLDREMLDQALDAQQRVARRARCRWKTCRIRGRHRTFSSKGERQHAEKCPGLTSPSGGSLLRHFSTANGQRGWKRHP